MNECKKLSMIFCMLVLFVIYVKWMMEKVCRVDTFGSKRLDENDTYGFRSLLCYFVSVYVCVWMWMVNIFILIVVFMELVVLVFKGEYCLVRLVWNEVMEICFDIIFIVDIVINFYCLIEKYGKLIWDKYVIVMKYFGGWFVIDLFVLLLIDFMFVGVIILGTVAVRVLVALGMFRLF